MDRQMDGRVDEGQTGMDRRMDGRMHVGCMEDWTEGWMKDRGMGR